MIIILFYSGVILWLYDCGERPRSQVENFINVKKYRPNVIDCQVFDIFTLGVKLRYKSIFE